MRAAAASGGDMTLPRFVQFMQHRGGKSAGAIRASLGIVSNARDVERFLAFIAEPARPDAPGARRGDVRHRVVPGHSRRADGMR